MTDPLVLALGLRHGLDATHLVAGLPAGERGMHLIVDTEMGHVRLGRAAPLAEVPWAELTTLGAPA